MESCGLEVEYLLLDFEYNYTGGIFVTVSEAVWLQCLASGTYNSHGCSIIVHSFLGYLGDRFRARKLIFLISGVILILMSLAPLLNPLFASDQNCNATSIVHLINQTRSNSNKTLCFKNVLDDFWKKSSSTFMNKSNSPLFTEGTSVFSFANFNRTVKPLQRSAYSLSSSSLFLYVILTRGVYEILKINIVSLSNLATITYIKKERANYGSYSCWGQIGGGFSLFAAGMVASDIMNTVCGSVQYGYYVTFPWVAFTISMSLFALPWVTFEYYEHRVINWDDVKSVLLENHYWVVFFVAFFSGWCFSFQFYWEYWYIYELSGSPVVMGICGLTRQPLTAIWFRISGSFIERLGDLQTMAVALLVYAASQFTLSLIENPWLVLVIDIFQSAAFALSYSALTVHFSKAGSKASSAVILGKIVNTLVPPNVEKVPPCSRYTLFYDWMYAFAADLSVSSKIQATGHLFRFPFPIEMQSVQQRASPTHLHTVPFWFRYIYSNIRIQDENDLFPSHHNSQNCIEH